jgi:hypothetical protein
VPLSKSNSVVTRKARASHESRMSSVFIQLRDIRYC